MAVVKSALYSEFLAGRYWYDWCFLALGLSLQALVLFLMPSSPVAMISAVAGVFSVFLCSQGKISNFLFGFVQVTTYLYVCFYQHLYGEVLINIFYFVSMVYGVFSWKKAYRSDADDQASVQTRRLSMPRLAGLLLVTCLVSVLAGWSLAFYTNDPQPYLDAFTTVPAIAAQLLMVFRYRDQWYLWLMIDVLAAWMWLRVADYAMMALYIFWCLNCLYGFHNWTSEPKDKQ